LFVFALHWDFCCWLYVMVDDCFFWLPVFFEL